MFFGVVFVLYESVKANSVWFFLPTIWWSDTLKRIEKIIPENTLYEQKKETRVSANRRSNNWALKFKFALSWRPPYTQPSVRNKFCASLLLSDIQNKWAFLQAPQPVDHQSTLIIFLA